mgnify:CR=1 FL=1
MAKIRVGLLLSEFPAVSETFILNQITGLINSGHVVCIYAKFASPNTAQHPEIKKYGLDDKTNYYTRVPESKKALRIQALMGLCGILFAHPLKTIRLLVHIFRSRNTLDYVPLLLAIDTIRRDLSVLHCHFGNNGNIGIKVKSFNPSIKLLTTFHGHDANSYPRKYGKGVYQELFQKGDLFTANTGFTAQQVQALGCDNRKIKILPMGIDISEFPWTQKSLNPGETVVCLTVARLVQKKGHQYAIYAMKKIVEKHANVCYQIVGNGPLEDELRSLVKTLSLEDNVQFMGALDSSKVKDLYRKAHLFLFPSITSDEGDREGQGLVLQEAQAMGLPIISTYHNGIPEGVLENESALLVPEKDIDALAEKLTYLIENPQRWPAMGRTGRAFVEKKYDINQLNQKLIEIYTELI